jgi:hypothetical protein
MLMIMLSALTLLMTAKDAHAGSAGGVCFNSGQWGRLSGLRSAVNKFAERRSDRRLCQGQAAELYYDAGKARDGTRYHYTVKVERVRPGCEKVDISTVLVAEEYISTGCRGDNDDTQGGRMKVGILADWEVTIDPNAG